MVQRGGLFHSSIEKITLIISVLTLIFVICIFFKTCGSEQFANNANNLNKKNNSNMISGYTFAGSSGGY